MFVLLLLLLATGGIPTSTAEATSMVATATTTTTTARNELPPSIYNGWTDVGRSGGSDRRGGGGVGDVRLWDKIRRRYENTGKENFIHNIPTTTTTRTRTAPVVVAFAVPPSTGVSQHPRNDDDDNSNDKNSRTTTTKKTTPIPPPPSLSMPVWSLATPAAAHPDNNNDDPITTTTAMNIVTFCSPVSVAPPPKKWMISLYHGTRTKDFFLYGEQGVLQLLTPNQSPLVSILGKHSGYEIGYSKAQACGAVGYEWIECSYLLEQESLPYPTFYLLPECAAYLHVQISKNDDNDKNNVFMEAGDHIVVLCDLLGVAQWNPETRKVEPCQKETLDPMDPSTVLYTGQLRKDGII